MELQAKYNSIIVQPKELEEASQGNIIIPDMGKENNEIAEVIDVGPGHYSVTGTFIETQSKVGDLVILPTMGFTKFKFQGEVYYIGKENEILGNIIK